MPTANPQELQLLLALVKAGPAGVFLVLVIAARRHPRTQGNCILNAPPRTRTLSVTGGTRPPRQDAYKISSLALYPHAREGLTFATTAINHVVPAGAALYTAARTDSYLRIYAHRVLGVLSTKGGTPTMARGTHPPRDTTGPVDDRPHERQQLPSDDEDPNGDISTPPAGSHNLRPLLESPSSPGPTKEQELVTEMG